MRGLARGRGRRVKHRKLACARVRGHDQVRAVRDVIDAHHLLIALDRIALVIGKRPDIGSAEQLERAAVLEARRRGHAIEGTALVVEVAAGIPEVKEALRAVFTRRRGDRDGGCTRGVRESGSVGPGGEVDNLAIGRRARHREGAVLALREGVRGVLQQDGRVARHRAVGRRKLHVDDARIVVAEIIRGDAAGSHRAPRATELLVDLDQGARNRHRVARRTHDEGRGAGHDAREADGGGAVRALDLIAGDALIEGTVVNLAGEVALGVGHLDGLAHLDGDRLVVVVGNRHVVARRAHVHRGRARRNAREGQNGRGVRGNDCLRYLVTRAAHGERGVQHVVGAAVRVGDDEVGAALDGLGVLHLHVAGELLAGSLARGGRAVEVPGAVPHPRHVVVKGVYAIELLRALVEVQVAALRRVAQVHRVCLVARAQRDDRGRSGVGEAGRGSNARRAVHRRAVRRLRADDEAAPRLGKCVEAVGDLGRRTGIPGRVAGLDRRRARLALLKLERGDARVELADVGRRVVAARVLEHGLLACDQVHSGHGHVDVRLVAHEIGEGHDLKELRAAGVLVQDGDVAVLELGERGVRIRTARLDHVVHVLPRDGLVVVDEANVQLAVGARAAARGRHRHDDRVLAVDLLRVPDRRELVARGLDLAGVNRLARRPDVILQVVVGVIQRGHAVAVELTDGVVVQRDRHGLARPVAGGRGVRRARPGLAFVLGVDDARELRLPRRVLIHAKHEGAVLEHRAGAGTNQQCLLVVVLHIDERRRGPRGAAVRRLGQVEIVGREHLERCIRAKEVRDLALGVRDVKEAVHGVALDLGAVGLVDGEGIQVEVIVVACAGGVPAVVIAAELDLPGVAQAQAPFGVETGAHLRCPFGAVEGDARRKEVDDHPRRLTVGRQRGIDERRRVTAPHVAVVAEVVRERVVPRRAAVGRTADDGVEAAAVAGRVPAGVGRGDDGAIVQRDHRGNAELGAPARLRGEGLPLGHAVVRAHTPLGKGARDAHRAGSNEPSGQSERHRQTCTFKHGIISIRQKTYPLMVKNLHGGS